MAIIAVDHVILAAPDLEEAAEPWRRLGLNPVYGTRHPGQGTENAVVFIGSDARTMFFVEFLAVHDRDEAARSERGRKMIEVVEAGGGMFRAVLETDTMAAVRAALEGAGIEHDVAEVKREDGTKIGDVLSLLGAGETSVDPRLIQYTVDRENRFASRRERGLFASTFDLVRLDHLALVPADFEGATRLWSELLGIPVAGEVRGSGVIIRQFKAGDAIVEFLAADGPGSRLAGAAPGLRSMIACEVDDLAAAVEVARERGFNPSEPARGILPGTRTATIPAGELSGVALQLLEYV